MHALAAGGSDPGGAAAGFAIIFTVIGAYWVPTIVALCRRRVVNTGSIVVINAFLGWSVVGWVVALAMACKSARPPQAVFYPYGPPPQLPPGRHR